ncbi:MAG: hypothetical protein K2O96_00385 [Lachnospiraceae bacterium]|nr:hypothetical protein [Lachnospiraceae bacterium]
MKNEFEIEYNETETILADMQNLYLKKQSAYTYKMILLIFGTFIFFVFKWGQWAELLTPSGIAFMMKFGVVWALCFVAGHHLNKTMFAKLNRQVAKERGKRYYEKRKEAFKGDMKVIVKGTAGEKFSVTSHGETIEYSYNRITKLFESAEIFAVLINIEHGNTQLVCFPKSQLGDMTEEEFKAFFIEKCIYVNKFKQVY